MKKKYSVVGIGNAIVDILGNVTENTLEDLGIGKGVMQLIGIDRSKSLLNSLQNIKQTSGGSAANTIAGLSQLGLDTAYIGKVKDDDLGKIFIKDLEKIGTVFRTPLADQSVNHETGRCIVMITPDGERSMNTYLGVTEFLSATDIDSDLISASKYVYLEGYRFDGPDSVMAFEKAVQIARLNEVSVALTLSDPFCVARHSHAFKSLIKESVDILFCNEEELKMLHGSNDLNLALSQISKDVTILACTLADKGSYVCFEGDTTLIPTKKKEVVDSTGAGDLFAAGFLYGLCTERGTNIAANLGNIAAGEIISHIGPRSEVDLLELFKQEKLI